MCFLIPQNLGPFAQRAIAGDLVMLHRLRGTDLVRPMLGGDKLLTAKVPASRDDLRARALALAIVAAAVALAVWVGAQGG